MADENVIPMNIEAGDLPEHPLVDFGRAFVRRLDDGLHGIPEVKSMNYLSMLNSIPDVERFPVGSEQRKADQGRKNRILTAIVSDFAARPTPDELRDRWSRMNMHEGGIEWDGATPNWTPGLKVTEEE